MTTITSNMLAPRRTARRSVDTDQRRGRALPLLWLQRLLWRSELKTLDIAQMRDCGLDPEIVRREAAKPFWRA